MYIPPELSVSGLSVLPVFPLFAERPGQILWSDQLQGIITPRKFGLRAITADMITWSRAIADMSTDWENNSLKAAL